MPAARGLGADALGDVSPWAPGSPEELARQRGPTFPSWVQLFAPSPASLLLFSPQLRDRAGSAHGTATSAISRGKAVLSDAESLMASLEGKGHRPEHLWPQLSSHHSGCRGEKKPVW